METASPLFFEPNFFLLFMVIRTIIASREEDELFEIPEAAEYLRVDEETMRKYVQRKVVPHIRISPHCVRIKKSDLDRWLASKRVEAAKNPFRKKKGNGKLQVVA
ncbi:MAG: helix-turn-helix domain-containing protein [Nitrospirales bacterium]|nr:helix-turn-helix domain-containing protein [Nitrospirales bacterium]